jgi:hypothetical protein
MFYAFILAHGCFGVDYRDAFAASRLEKTEGGQGWFDQRRQPRGFPSEGAAPQGSIRPEAPFPTEVLAAAGLRQRNATGAALRMPSRNHSRRLRRHSARQLVRHWGLAAACNVRDRGWRGGCGVTSPRLLPAPSSFSCDGRNHCSKMPPCEKATFFLRICSGVQIDGAGGGVPCEEQWCGPGGALSRRSAFRGPQGLLHSLANC